MTEEADDIHENYRRDCTDGMLLAKELGLSFEDLPSFVGFYLLVQSLQREVDTTYQTHLKTHDEAIKVKVLRILHATQTEHPDVPMKKVFEIAAHLVCLEFAETVLESTARYFEFLNEAVELYDATDDDPPEAA